MENDAPASAPVVPSIDKLAAALAKAQGEFPVIPKDSEVVVYSKEPPKRELYRYKYADLTTIIDKTRPALSKNGLSFTQGMVANGLVTTLMHESGQVLKAGFVPCESPKSSDYKAVAGMFTYVKRISLTAALGVSADEDVDAAAEEAKAGNSTTKGPATKGAAAPAAKTPPPAKQQPPQNAPADKDMMEQMLNHMIDRGVHENSVANLISKGYGFKADKPPVWVWQEIMQLLENEDCNDKTIERKFQEVLKRREAKAKGGA